LKKELKPQDDIQLTSIVGNLTIEFDFSAVLVTGGDATSTGYLNSAAATQKDVLVKSIQEDLNKAVEDYFDMQSQIRTNTVTVSTALPTKSKYDIKFDFTQDPNYENTGVTYFFSKNVTKQEDSSSLNFLGDDEDTVKEFVFDPTKGKFQLFVKFNVLKPIIDDISKSEAFYFNVRPSNLPASIKTIKLNIEQLTSVLPDIHKYVERDENITVSGQVKNITVDSSIATKGNCSVIFNVFGVGDASKALLSWVSNFDYELVPHKVKGKANFFNFQLQAVSLTHTSIRANQYSSINTVALNDIIEDVVSTYIANENSFELFKGHIDLGSMFSTTDDAFEVVGDGLLIGGNPNEAPLLAGDVKKEFFRKLIEAI